MINIYKFKDFILNEEHSKNDPIIELNTSNKLGIILLGVPGIGKSYFVKNFIIPRNSNIKTFSTDDVSLSFTKDPNVYYKNSSKLNLDRLFGFIERDMSFIYDTTGVNQKNIINVFDKAKERDFDIIFIHLIGEKEIAEKGNISRDRKVSSDYIKKAYGAQSSIIKNCLELKPKSYYFVERSEKDYQFYKLDQTGKTLKRNKFGEYEMDTRWNTKR